MKISGRQTGIMLLAAVVLLILGVIAFADTMSSPNFLIDRSVVAGGGGEAASAGYTSPGSATGQSSAIGSSTSAGYSLTGGYFGAPLNSAPVATDQTITSTPPMRLSYGGGLSATDADGDTLTYSIVDNPFRGTVNITNPATGAFIYTPSAGQSGSDSFTFKASDGTDDSNIATITFSAIDTIPPAITVNPVTSPTNLTGQTITGVRESGAVITANSSTATLAAASYPTLTTWSIAVSAMAQGANSINVIAIDPSGNSNQATATITVDSLPPTITINPVTTPTAVTSQTVSGTREANATVTVITNTGATVGVISYGTATTWSAAISGLKVGANIVTATAKDALNNSASDSKTITVTGGKPGDCNGDGSVSIAEVQAAINIYLGLMPATGCVDTDGSGSVSIAEVQKVINGYLGL